MINNIDNYNRSASQSSSSQSSSGAVPTREDQLRELQDRVVASQLRLLEAFGATQNTLNQFPRMSDSERQIVLRQHSENYQAQIAEPRNDPPLRANRSNDEALHQSLRSQGVIVIGGDGDRVPSQGAGG